MVWEILNQHQLIKQQLWNLLRSQFCPLEGLYSSSFDTLPLQLSLSEGIESKPESILDIRGWEFVCDSLHGHLSPNKSSQLQNHKLLRKTEHDGAYLYPFLLHCYLVHEPRLKDLALVRQAKAITIEQGEEWTVCGVFHVSDTFSPCGLQTACPVHFFCFRARSLQTQAIL